MTDEQNLADKIEVTQADRDAAATVWRNYVARVGEVMAEKAIREGKSDDTCIVQAFARHRIAALRLAETSSASASPEAASALADRVGTSATLSRRNAELGAENARLREMMKPEWFYLAGDMSSDKCRFSVWEVIDEDWLWDNRAEGTAVVQIETATRCPDVWALVHFFTDEEKDARQSDDDYEITEYASEEAARAALGGSTDGA